MAYPYIPSAGRPPVGMRKDPVSKEELVARVEAMKAKYAVDNPAVKKRVAADKKRQKIKESGQDELFEA